MVRHLTRFGLSAVLLLAVLGPARAADPPPSDSNKLDGIVRQLDGIQKQLDTRLLYAEGEILNLKRRVEQLESQLRAREEADRRVARAFTPPALSGSITLQNRSAYLARIVLDGSTTYFVGPGATVTLPPRPVGPFTYEISADPWGVITPPTTRYLTAERPFTIFVNP